MLIDWMDWSTDEKFTEMPDVPVISAIRQKHSSHKKGPIVEPCPGPSRGTVLVLQ